MTQNQIRYQEHLEDVRHNLASEQEIKRNNVVVSNETNRHNLVTEGETSRHNKVQEAVQMETNTINREHYQRMDNESRRHNIVAEKETKRHNYSEEMIGARNATTAANKALWENQVATINANTNYMNAETAQTNAETQRWNAFHSFVVDDEANYITQSFNQYKADEILANIESILANTALAKAKAKTEDTVQAKNTAQTGNELVRFGKSLFDLINVFN